MKAEIDEKGMLNVFAETPLETYALRKGVEDNAVGLQDGSAVFKSIVAHSKDFNTQAGELPKICPNTRKEPCPVCGTYNGWRSLRKPSYDPPTAEEWAVASIAFQERHDKLLSELFL